MYYREPHATGQVRVMAPPQYSSMHQHRFSPSRSRSSHSYHRRDPQPVRRQHSEPHRQPRTYHEEPRSFENHRQQIKRKLSFRLDKKGRHKHDHQRAPRYLNSVNEIPLPVRLTANGIVLPKMCWNCGEGHTINECDFPRNQGCVKVNRRWQMALEQSKQQKKSASTSRLIRNTRPKPRKRYGNKRYFVEKSSKEKSKSKSKSKSRSARDEDMEVDSRPPRTNYPYPQAMTPSSSSTSGRDEREDESSSQSEKPWTTRQRDSGRNEPRNPKRRPRRRPDDGMNARARLKDNSRSQKRWREHDEAQDEQVRKRRRIEHWGSQSGGRSRESSERAWHHRRPPPVRSYPPHYNPFSDERQRRDYGERDRSRAPPPRYHNRHPQEYQRHDRWNSRDGGYDDGYGRRDRHYRPRQASPRRPSPPVPMRPAQPYPTYETNRYGRHMSGVRY